MRGVTQSLASGAATGQNGERNHTNRTWCRERGLSMTTMKYRASSLLLLVMLLTAVAGCGQKGDLYLPDGAAKKHDFVTH